MIDNYNYHGNGNYNIKDNYICNCNINDNYVYSIINYYNIITNYNIIDNENGNYIYSIITNYNINDNYNYSYNYIRSNSSVIILIFLPSSAVLKWDDMLTIRL